MKTLRNVNWRTLGNSAKHLLFVCGLAVLAGGMFAVAEWMRFVFGAGFCVALAAVYKIEIYFRARRESRRGVASRTWRARLTGGDLQQPRSSQESVRTPDPVHAPVSAARVVPESDEAIDAEETAIFTLMDLGYPRAEAAKIARGPAQPEKLRKAA